MFCCLFAGVPFSTQWTADGHFYPIQIAQFGLSHYSKHLVEGEPEVLVMEDGEEEDVADWARPDNRARIRLLRDSSRGSNVVEFAASGVLSTGCGVVWWVAVPCGLGGGGWVFFVRCVVNECTVCCTWLVWCAEHCVVNECTLCCMWLVWCVEHWVWCGGWLYHVDHVVGGCSS